MDGEIFDNALALFAVTDKPLIPSRWFSPQDWNEEYERSRPDWAYRPTPCIDLDFISLTFTRELWDEFREILAKGDSERLLVFLAALTESQLTELTAKVRASIIAGFNGRAWHYAIGRFRIVEDNLSDDSLSCLPVCVNYPLISLLQKTFFEPLANYQGTGIVYLLATYKQGWVEHLLPGLECGALHKDDHLWSLCFGTYSEDGPMNWEEILEQLLASHIPLPFWMDVAASVCYERSGVPERSYLALLLEAFDDFIASSIPIHPIAVRLCRSYPTLNIGLTYYLCDGPKAYWQRTYWLDDIVCIPDDGDLSFLLELNCPPQNLYDEFFELASIKRVIPWLVTNLDPSMIKPTVENLEALYDLASKVLDKEDYRDIVLFLASPGGPLSRDVLLENDCLIVRFTTIDNLIEELIKRGSLDLMDILEVSKSLSKEDKEYKDLKNAIRRMLRARPMKSAKKTVLAEAS